MKYGLPVSKQSKAWKKSHKPGPAFPLGNRRQASSARGFAVMMLNKKQLTLGEARQIVSASTRAGLSPAKLVKRDGRYTTVLTNKRKAPTMAKRSKKRTVRRAKRKGTRKGQIRRSSRRAYVGTKQARAARRRSRARRNPAFFRSPAARYSLAALAGAAAAAVLDANAEGEGIASRLQIPLGNMTLSAGVTVALLTLGLSRVFKLKATTRATATAAAIGMLAPSAITTARNLATGGAPAIGTTNNPLRRSLLAAPAPRNGTAYNSAAVFVNDLIPA